MMGDHPSASMFYKMGKIKQQENQRAENEIITSHHVFMHIRTDRADDQRR